MNEAAGKERTRRAGVAGRCQFLERDACEPAGIESARFDRVIGSFGASSPRAPGRRAPGHAGLTGAPPAAAPAGPRC